MREWEELIGYNPFKLFKVVGQNNAFYRMDKWSRTEGAVVGTKKYNGTLGDGRAGGMPHGSILDFNKCRVEYQPGWMLSQWLTSRGIQTRQDTTRDQLIATVCRCLTLWSTTAQNEEILSTAVLERHKNTNSNWSTKETLSLSTDTQLVWTQTELLSFLKDNLEPVTLKSILCLNGKRNGIRKRALLRITSGHYETGNWHLTHCTFKEKDGEVEVVMIRCKVTPSMKSEVYDVYLVFKPTTQGNKYTFLRGPSYCGCPNGSFFCSHMLGFYILFFVIQAQNFSTLEDLTKIMPKPIKSLYELGIPLRLIYNRENVLEKLQASGASNSIMNRAKQDVENNNDDDNEAVEPGEAAVYDTASKFFKKLAPGFPGYSDSGSEPVNDEALEILAEEDTQKTPAINVLEEISKFFIAAKLRQSQQTGETKEDKESGAELTQKQIEDYVTARVKRIETTERENQKLRRHERLYRAMRDELLSKNNALYPYLEFHKTEREQEMREKNIWENL
jgi:hypothetical protein